MQNILCSKSDEETALEVAKVHFMCKSGSVFFSSVSMNLEHVFSLEIPTASTNGKRIMYNPEFFMSLSPEERVGLIYHEAAHVAFMHMFRRGDRDMLLWNYAADYVINILGKDSGFKLPAGGLCNDMFREWSSDQVYEYLYDNAIQVPQGYISDLEESLEGKSKEEIEVLEQEVTNIVMASTQRAQMSAGRVPAEIARTIDNLINPKLNWKELLFRFVDSKIKEDSTWKRPNHKYLPNFYLPSKQTDAIQQLTVAIDTSGSITQEYLIEMLSEIQYINEVLKPSKLTILDCDTQINNTYHVDNNDSILDYEFTGGGGTDVMPVIEYCKKHETNVLVYFTDGEFTAVTEQQSYPILWVISGNPNFTTIVGEVAHV